MAQQTAWLLTLAVVGAFTAVFLWVAFTAQGSADYARVASKAGRARRLWFWALILGGVAAAGMTLPLMPYPRAEAAPGDVQVVTATGRQGEWTLSAATVKAGRPVEFRVTSADVNHGFAIYDDKLKIVAQTQAMPGYVNRLRHTFAEPGRYRILCLEYCGLVHHDMAAEFVVSRM